MNKYQEAYERLSSRTYQYADKESVYKDIETLGELVDKATPKRPQPLFLPMKYIPYRCPILNDCDLLSRFADEYFSNPSLKFEELKEGMWVWDNQQNEWIKINRLKMVIISINNYRYYIYKTNWNIPIEFEENRFYRKRVEE